jgi:hypothetical protein
MILVLFIWVLIFLIFLTFGFSLVRVFKKISAEKDESSSLKLDGYFFLGFLSFSVITGILSIFIPISVMVLLVTGILFLVLLIIHFNDLISELKRSARSITAYSNRELLILAFLVFFVLTAVVQNITWLDTQSYHAQNIQWIKKYAVVPGLGNLHDRFAFNSMFFVISALFTFQIRDILVFPLNGICYIVLIIKLFSLYFEANRSGKSWKSVFYALTLLISLLMMIPNLNTPSPDMICATLIIYLFIIILGQTNEARKFSSIQVILIALLIFTCITYKLSSLFLISSAFLFLSKDFFKRSILTIVIFLLIVSPFIVRNYFLSGYLIYPFPAIDIFNVDWKIPLNNVIETKSVIEGWARIPVTPYPEVLGMKFSEWIFPWFTQLSFFSKLVVTVNFFSFFTFIVMLIRKEFFLAKIQFIILINLIFWFLQAPDLRFAFGFIFLGFSLTIAYIFKLFEKSVLRENGKYIKIALACFLVVILCRRISFPGNTIRTPSLWIKPAAFGTVETKEYSTNFNYSIPVAERECFNTDIPCVTYTLNNVYLRGSDFKDGFKVINRNK